MCGIVGIVDQGQLVDQHLLIQQRDRVVHRGPDDAGFWISPSRSVGLAHRRLSIIDLSETGHQPMASSDERYVIVFNGEVYNFKELRKELEGLGYIFKGSSDTEVVLNSYIAWGDKCLSRFNGMFALAILDQGDENTASSLFFARDRAGKKPFYYLQENNRFQFASELKALNYATSINVRALNYYLARGYVPKDLCLADGVKKLPPAHAAKLDLDRLSLKVWRYWDLPPHNPDTQLEVNDLLDTTQDLFVDAVKLRLNSDVPVGVLLSGGVDSSLIAAAAARQLTRKIQTFTVSFHGTSYDEAAYAQRIADYFSTDHHVLRINRPSLGILEELSKFIDEPIADSSLIPSFMVSKLTRQHVKVALGGDGGDELFGGYTDYPRSLADQKYFGWMPSRIMNIIGEGASLLPAGIKGRNRLASLRGGALQQMIWGSPYFDVSLRRRILNKNLVSALDQDFTEPEHWLLKIFDNGSDPLDRMTRTHFGSILADDFLVKVDRASMANSLEIRNPFLDYRLAEFAFSSIPSNWKVKGQKTRMLQIKLAKRLLPSDHDTNRKQGFSIPLDAWMRADHCSFLRTYIPYLEDLIDCSELEKMIKGQIKGRTNGSRLYALLMLGIAIKNNGW